MKDINVEDIVQEIRDDIATKGYTISDLEFNDIKIQNPDFFNAEKLAKSLSEVSINCHIDMYPKVSGGKIKRFIKKLIRKIVRPSFFGTMKKQENFNINTVIALNEMAKKILELEERIKESEGNNGK